MAAEPKHIVNDPQMRDVKSRMMGSLKWNALLNSVSRATALIAGPVVASSVIGGLGLAVTKIGELGIGAALMAGFTTPILATLAIGVAFAAVSIGSDYMASRIYQSKQFDNLEVNAQSTAHHLVQELKANNMCLVNEHSAPCRADGKSWGQFLQARAQENAAQISRFK